jgi:hypothetical protein
VLTWNSTLGGPEWQDAGTGFAYQTTNAAVTSATGANTSAKISAAIGNPSYIGQNATCIVTGDPGTVYEGLYIWGGSAWRFAAHFAYNTASQVPATNPMTSIAASTQVVLNALKVIDDGLQGQITTNNGDIATLQGQMATAQTDIVNLQIDKLDTASNVPVAGQILSFDGTGQLWVSNASGDVTSVSGTSPITVDNTDPQNPVVGINAASTSAAGAVQLSTSLSSTSITQASTPFAVKAVNDAAVAAQATADAAIPDATFTAAGELLYSTGSGTYTVLPAGNPGEVLQCNGTAAPTWVLPAVINYSSTKVLTTGTPVPLLSWTAGIRLGTLVISGKSNLGELAWANITVSASSGVGSSVITSSAGDFGLLSLVSAGSGFQVVFTPTVSRPSANFYFQYSATFGDQPTVL